MRATTPRRNSHDDRKTCFRSPARLAGRTGRNGCSSRRRRARGEDATGLVHHFLGILYDALLAPNKDRQLRVVERVLAATFTRAAAGEIIDRILGVLADAMLGTPHGTRANSASNWAPRTCARKNAEHCSRHWSPACIGCASARSTRSSCARPRLFRPSWGCRTIGTFSMTRATGRFRWRRLTNSSRKKAA